MAGTQKIPGLRREGKTLIIQLPQRGRIAARIPDELVDTLLQELQDMTLESREGIVVPEEQNQEEPRLFDKQHQATNYGRKLKEQMAAKNAQIVEHIQISTPGISEDQNGKAQGPFLLALAKK